jgi:hypothetical protein
VPVTEPAHYRLRDAQIRAILKHTKENQPQMTKNLHISHPEDEVLTGNLDVLDWFVTPGHLSVKIDGAPAVVWGTNPENGRFFTGTKSVFNKKKIKICYTEADIFALYDETTQAPLIEILCACLKYLPRTEYIIQGDFIGFGGSDEYTPNTITYKFPEIVRQTIILAPHTEYYTETTLHDAVAYPMGGGVSLVLSSTDTVKFVQPPAYILHDPWNRSSGTVCFDDVEEVCKFVRVMAQTVTFVSEKEAAKIKQQLNACIRSGDDIVAEDFDCDPNLIGLWALVKTIKDDCLFLCRNDGPAAYINGNRIDAEGYVLSNEFGLYKLVNREVFSYANFNSQRFQSV